MKTIQIVKTQTRLVTERVTLTVPDNFDPRTLSQRELREVYDGIQYRAERVKHRVLATAYHPDPPGADYSPEVLDMLKGVSKPSALCTMKLPATHLS